jgi:hypothetical protein
VLLSRTLREKLERRGGEIREMRLEREMRREETRDEMRERDEREREMRREETRDEMR